MRVTQAEIRSQVKAIASIVEGDRPGVLESLARDALAELASWPEIAIEWMPEADTGEGCSVAGSYNADVSPPVLCIELSASPGRRQFTALHELGHHVQQSDYELAAAIVTSHDPHGLEEGACNLFAASTLLPADIVDRHIGARGPTAAEVVSLFAGSQASRAACCVRAAERLRSPGVVMLLDHVGVVSFAQPAGGFIPPARRSDQSATPLVSAALRAGRARIDTFVRYRTGGRSDTVYGDCVVADGWLIVVLAADRVPWRSFSASRPGTGTRGNATWWTCESCGEQFAVSDRCLTCGQPKCPSAGHCGCSLARERRCSECFMVRHVTQFKKGGTVCRECRAD